MALTATLPFISRGASSGVTVNGGRKLLLRVAEALLEPLVLREPRDLLAVEPMEEWCMCRQPFRIHHA